MPEGSPPAGSDPTGGAGLQADLQVFRALGVHGAGVVTALTVQDTHRVHQSLPAFPNVVLDQIRTLLRDITPAAVKLGMLATDDTVLTSLAARGMRAVPDADAELLVRKHGLDGFERCSALTQVGPFAPRPTAPMPRAASAPARTKCIEDASISGCLRCHEHLCDVFSSGV